MKNLQTLHIFHPLSSLLQLLSFLKFLSVLALILLFIVPHHGLLRAFKVLEALCFNNFRGTKTLKL
jgi:hypothetical protein